MFNMQDIIPTPLENELQSSYIDYAMSVIIGRAIPDARDGLKPVQRRILYSMYNLKNFSNQPTKKSARIVGDTMGKLHPHGDMAIYDALARLAQNFSTNHLLVEGQGNFGCFTKDTKVKLTDGRNATFEELINDYNNGKRNWAFTFNTDKKTIEVAEITNPRITRKDAQLVEINLDNNEKIKCTPDHRFLLRNFTYKQAKDLQTGESIMPLYIQAYGGELDKNLKDYDMVLQPAVNKWQFVHHIADEWNIQHKIYTKSKGRIRHHIDINKKNNNPNNIIRLNWEEHNNRIPRAENTLKYFSSFEDVIKDAKTYNHKVKAVRIILEKEDTYDLTIGPWHNFALASGIFVHNSVDGDPPAAQRYTEVRLTKLAEEILEDIDKDTVEFIPNFDDTEREPTIMPSKVPNLLVNGATGIAVGVATSIPPHNLGEVCDAIIHRIDKKDSTADEILNIIKGPDFPTGGIALMSQNAYNGYKYGRGQLSVRAKADVDDKQKKIVVREIPYNVNKSNLMQTMAQLAREKKINGLRDIRDESDKSGIRIVIDFKEETNGEQILNMLYKYTQLQTTFPIINLAVIGKSLKSLNIIQFIDSFLTHRREVILKRSKYELNVAKDRLHIVEGLLIAITSIDSIIKTIKASAEVREARSKLVQEYKLTEKQANAILDMKLSRLTHLENNSLNEEKKDLEKKVSYYEGVIASPATVDTIIKEETLDIKKRFGRPRRTEIQYSEEETEITNEDTISNEKVTVILTNNGYVKKLALANYKEQGRGGKGIIAINLKEGDYAKQILTCHNKDFIICITNAGRAYWIKTYNIPEGGRYAEGKAIVNLVETKEEKIIDILNISDFKDSKIAFLTEKGTVKKVDAALFSKPRSSGVRAITLEEGDHIADVIMYSNEKNLIIASKQGQAIKFDESDLRYIGRTAMGVRGIRLDQGDKADNIIAANESGSILTITENGYGKITDVNEYRLQGRGGSGVINLKVNEKTGPVQRCLFLKSPDEKVVIINSLGVSITFPTNEIRVTGRAASGVRLMHLSAGEKVVDAMLLSNETPQA